MPHGDWDSLSAAQNAALKALAACPNGSAVAGSVRPAVRISTWKSLQRFSLIRTPGHVEPEQDTVVTITFSGLESIGFPTGSPVGAP